MLKILNQGVGIIITSAILFFLALWYFCIGWANVHGKKSLIIGFFVSSIYTFRFLVRTFLIILLFSIIWQLGEYFLPSISIPRL
ncbi:MAG: hypothetical protein ABH876_01990 [Patescibacteria group bacterium]|nr:hypothetical protein [Patescibacteria group bacterium]MBU1877049.1 hypothetical protein [Patescibacteria group bacterium]